jgi:hypothetical protein
MCVAQRRKPRHIFLPDFNIVSLQMIERRIHITGIPENQSIQDETKRTQLILLPLAVTLPKFTSLAMKTLASQSIASFTAI